MEATGRQLGERDKVEEHDWKLLQTKTIKRQGSKVPRTLLDVHVEGGCSQDTVSGF